MRHCVPHWDNNAAALRDYAATSLPVSLALGAKRSFMKIWEYLTFIQKAVVGTTILCIAVFAPEIALLVQFGGIEVAFAFLALYLAPILGHINNHYKKVKHAASLALISYQTSASAKPKVFFVQAAFCCIGFAVTGSLAFSVFFFMPSIVLNGVLI